MVQVYNVSTEAVHSVDITQQNTVSKERAASPQNSEVEKIAISADGQNMATVDCLWSDLNRILLKFWSWSEDIVNYTLNTQVEFPHQSGVQSICFQPNTGHRSQVRPMLLTVGCDDKAKVWRLGSNNWSCESCISYKQLKTRAGVWRRERRSLTWCLDGDHSLDTCTPQHLSHSSAGTWSPCPQCGHCHCSSHLTPALSSHHHHHSCPSSRRTASASSTRTPRQWKL